MEGEGRKHHVGLFHGKNNGHVMIHCNAKVIIIDFNVLESKTYSFFINQELCEIELERKGDTFYYHFHVNHTADTPLNRVRKARERKFWRQALLFIGALVLCVTLLVVLMNRWNRPPDLPTVMERLAKEGLSTESMVFPDHESQTLKYLFVLNGRSYEGEMSMDKGFFNKFGLPIGEKDELMVRYIPTNPNINHLQLDQASPGQLRKYIDMTIAEHLEANPDLNKQQATCEVVTAARLFGNKALGDFYFQSLRPSENEVNNERTYRFLQQDAAYRKAVEENCGD